MHDAHWPNGAYAAEFRSERAFAGAVRLLREEGYTRMETYTPYSVERVEGATPAPPARLGLGGLAFLGGVAGATIAYWIQWYANVVAFPLDIGGRPVHAVPAFFIPTFEGTVLGAALAAFIGLFWSLRLPRLWHPMFEVDGFESAMVDSYWIAIDARDHRGTPDLIANTMLRLEPFRVVYVWGDAGADGRGGR